MVYEKQNFKDGLTLFASQLNHIEDGIVTLANSISDSDGGVEFIYPESGEVFTSVVPEAVPVSISASYSGGNVAIGTSVYALVGVVVTATYSNGTTKAVTGYKLSGSIAKGSNTITVTYEGLTTTFTVTGVEAAQVVTLTSISAIYAGGSVAAGTAVTDLTDITVIAHYSDGSTAPVTGYTLSGEIAEGSNTITVGYGGKTTTFTVTGKVGGEPGQSEQEGRAIIGDDGYIVVDVMTLRLKIDRTVASSGFATFHIAIPSNEVLDTTSEVLCKDKFTYLGTSYNGIRNGTSSPEVQYGYGYDGVGGGLLIRIPYSDYESVGATSDNAIAAIALHNRYIPFKLKDSYNTYSITEEAVDAARYYQLPSLKDGYYNGWLYCSNGGTKTQYNYICNYGGFGSNQTTEWYSCDSDPDPNQRLYVRVPEGAIADATTLDGWKAFLKSRLPIEWYGA